MGQTREERVVVWQRFVFRPEITEGRCVETVQRALTRAELSGAEVLSLLGSTIVLSFDGVELEDAVELARTEIDDLLEQEDGLAVHIALGLGEIEVVDDPARGRVFRGAVFDRAQALAHRARPGEIVLDEAAVQRAEERFLFTRELIASGARGQALDPTHPDKRVCRAALAELAPMPLAKSAEPILEELLMIARAPGQQRVALYSELSSAAIELIEHCVRSSESSLVLRMSRKAGGYQPLGSLCVGLRGLWPDDAMLVEAPLRAEVHDVCSALLKGTSVPRSEVVEALVGLCRAYTRGGQRPLLVLDSLHEIDPATLGVVAEAVMTPDLDIVLLMSVPPGVGVPAQLVPANQLYRLELPNMTPEDGEHIAETLLALPPRADVAQRVALLGGDSSIGVREAARTLVAAGDLVLRQKRFGWRIAPRSAAGALPLESLITERIAGLGPSAYRVLEGLCVIPPDATRELLDQVLTRDGLPAEEIESGLAQLRAEGFAEGRLSLGLADAAIRGALRSNMPAARGAELHRFVADVLAKERALPGFGSGELAYHLAEGGLEKEAAAALIDAAKAAANTGFQRVALRLLATAVKLDSSVDIRRAARELARTVDASIVPAPRVQAGPPAPPPAGVSVRPARLEENTDDYEELKSEDLKPAVFNMAQSAMRSAIQALEQEDFDGVERWLDAAVAAGFGKAAAQRVLAITQLARGEMHHATQTLQRAHSDDAPPSVRARDRLSWALVRMTTGDVLLAVRDALDALALSRRTEDRGGQLAAMHVLAQCYRLLERTPDAARIAQAASELRASV
ncbi:MAG TPA: hypothetical protein VFG30_28600 [Polyangiales bacterium]|nr:hypothetical protein [Polyangiales bacterium]